MKFQTYTLGCKVNFAESSTFARSLEKSGWVRAKVGEVPDSIVVNTCSVTAAADKKCRNLITRLHRQFPDAEIVATGCYATRVPGEVAELPGVARVESNADKPLCAWSVGDRTRSFLKVQDGCDYKCSYCTIHSARGDSRNPSIAELVDRTREIAAAGVREIVLTGVNTGDFGRSTDERFIDLLRALDKEEAMRGEAEEISANAKIRLLREHRLFRIDEKTQVTVACDETSVRGIERFRISSIEPNLLTDEVIDFCASSPRFMPHFHLPLQSGCDRILGLMRRRYTTSIFAERVAKVRQKMPDTFFGIDVIVGFPGETDADFEETYQFLETLKPAELHIFPYSVRPGTPAAQLPDRVPPAKIAARAKRLGELSERLHNEFREQFRGKPAQVLWESTRKNGKMSGLTENYLRVEAPFDATKINTITEVIL